MGLLDRLKKKKAEPQPEETSSENSEVNSSDSYIDDEDPMSLMDAVDIDGTSSSSSGSDYSDIDSVQLDGEEGEDEKKKSPPDKKPLPVKLIAGIAVALLFLLIFVAVGAYFLFREPDYQPIVEKAMRGFFTDLSKGNLKVCFDQMLPEVRQKSSLEQFEKDFKSARFLLTDIENIGFQATRYNETNGIGTHAGDFSYSDGSRGFFTISFEVQKIDKERKVLLKGFKVESEDRRNKFFRSAFSVVEEFLKTFDDKKLEEFKGFMYPTVREALGNLKINLLHSRLVESGFRDVVFKSESMIEHAPSEITFIGVATTKLGTRMRGEISLFYEEGVWLVTMVNFIPDQGA
ncbi:MAG: hypothetical protein H3C47_06110 [Candidatus Cloacimonetes bacterium]|nr:hypothetical protein [Candidatus Cloacimonadota bacterium]